jgi:hypothetical protein
MNDVSLLDRQAAKGLEDVPRLAAVDPIAVQCLAHGGDVAGDLRREGGDGQKPQVELLL